jgi:hypothetical protein
MCLVAVELVDFDELSEAQKKALLKDLQKRRDTLQEQLESVNGSLKSVNQAIKVVVKKSK